MQQNSNEVTETYWQLLDINILLKKDDTNSGNSNANAESPNLL